MLPNPDGQGIYCAGLNPRPDLPNTGFLNRQRAHQHVENHLAGTRKDQTTDNREAPLATPKASRLDPPNR
jgi:hypothetical protein